MTLAHGTAPLLELRDLRQSYDDLEIVRGLSLRLARGAIGCLLGASGCGKTTVLRCIAGFETLRAGSIRLNGALVSGPGVMLPAQTVAGGLDRRRNSRCRRCARPQPPPDHRPPPA